MRNCQVISYLNSIGHEKQVIIGYRLSFKMLYMCRQLSALDSDHENTAQGTH